MSTPAALWESSDVTSSTQVTEKGDPTESKNSQNSSLSLANEAPETKDNENTSEQEKRPIQGWRWFAICTAVYGTSILYGLDTTIAASIQANAVEDFGSVQKLAWLGTGFSLGSIAIIMSLGKAYGIFNLRYLYFGFIVLFEAGSALCGAAPNMNALVFGRIWAGLGGAGMYLGGLNTVAIFTTNREKALYMGLIALFWGVGCILGPIIGGAFADSSATWRWAFYINLVCFGALLPAYAFLPSFDPQPTKPLSAKLREMDWIGAILNAAVYATFVIALTFGGATWAWNAGGTIGTFVAFGVILIAFILQQTFAILTTEESRIFPVEFLRRRIMILLYVLTACSATAVFVTVYYIPLYFQFVHGENGITSAVRLLPFIFLFVLAVLMNGIIMPRSGWYMPWFGVGTVLITIGSALMHALVNSHTGNGAIYGYSVLLAIGCGLTIQAAYSIAPAKVGPARTADTVSFINSAQIGGVTIALSISGTVFQNIAYQRIQTATVGMGFTSADIHGAISGTKSIVFDNTSPEVRAQVIEGIVDAISQVYIMVISAGALGIVCSILLPREKLYMTANAGG
ncbi:major facilitator superfamily domain-containing protein [Talaromyces proteolyticus]|uniref:Major facilitator superfamily domain-containing protein n=1 Tax=Talaromyces proteolyticus TaxID=1131652 RepID=A0AAD4L2C7_9EURO|nr:major facilitator superfamily domain-containing protein [Talaromyces proteolyticus]KAH8704708.1 major facilitator superfamily domain-containing protein [Talaromyces proteolyticus]